MSTQDLKVSKIDDDRLVGYTKRTRYGPIQIFYTGSDHRDFERYRNEGGGRKNNVEMHDKPDTIRMVPPEVHYYAELIDGEWWWLNGCATCNGRKRGIACYIECVEHDVCATCQTPNAEVKGTRWGVDGGWRCESCQVKIEEARRAEALAEFDEENYSSWNFLDLESVECPYCGKGVDYEYAGDDAPPPEECPTCKYTFAIEVGLRPVYATKRIEPKREEDMPSNGELEYK